MQPTNSWKKLSIMTLFAVFAISELSVYNTRGVGWDFLSHYLNSRTFATDFRVHYSGKALSVGNGFYFDGVWGTTFFGNNGSFYCINRKSCVA